MNIKGKQLIYIICTVFLILAIISVVSAETIYEQNKYNKDIPDRDTGNVKDATFSINKELNIIAASEPIDTVLNIQVLDENGVSIPDLNVELYYCDSGERISGGTTNEHGIVSFSVSTELNYQIFIESQGSFIEYGPIVIPSGTSSFTYTAHLYALGNDESSIELRSISGTPLANTGVDISSSEGVVWSGTLDNNGIAIVSGLDSELEYNIEFDLPESYFIIDDIFCLGPGEYYTFTITPTGLYHGNGARYWFDWFYAIPDSINQPGTDIMLEYDSFLSYNELVYTIVDYSSVYEYDYRQSIHHTDSTVNSVQLPDLPIGYHTIFGKIENAGSIIDIEYYDMWIYDANSYPDYDISISYPTIATNNNLDITITVSSDTGKIISNLIRDNIGGNVEWGSCISPGEIYSNMYSFQADPDESGYIDITILLYDGPEVYHKTISDVQAQRTDLPVDITLSISYQADPGEIYDTNGIPGIQKDEATAAINDYLLYEIINKQVAVDVINCYFDI